jgi:hypothetical protein
VTWSFCASPTIGPSTGSVSTARRRFIPRPRTREGLRSRTRPSARPPEELVHHDLDSAIRRAELGTQPNCSNLLNIWKLADDVARSVNEPFESRGAELDNVYNEFFFGTNPPAMTPPSETYHPDWTQEELALLHATVEKAVSLIRSHV